MARPKKGQQDVSFDAPLVALKRGNVNRIEDSVLSLEGRELVRGYQIDCTVFAEFV